MGLLKRVTVDAAKLGAMVAGYGTGVAAGMAEAADIKIREADKALGLELDKRSILGHGKHMFKKGKSDALECCFEADPIEEAMK